MAKSKDLTMSVDDQMLTLLEIMANGEDILPIGVWEAPVKRLAMKEFAVRVGSGYRITDAGRAFFAKSEGVEFEQVAALAPPMPDWIINVLPGEPASLVVLRKDPVAVSGYSALRPAQFQPIAHQQMQDMTATFMRVEASEVDGFLQAMMDAAWARGLRPTEPS